jgi:hypothetical protein
MEPFWFITGIIMMLPKVKEEEEIELERIEEEEKKEEEGGMEEGWHWDY